MARRQTQTGGREATTGTIVGAYSLSVGNPNRPIPEGWKWTRLMDVARLESGHTPSRRHPEYWNGEIPWIGIRDATSNYGRTIYDTVQHTNQLGIDNSSARILPEGTVCLSRTASVGYVVVMGRPMATSQDFVNWVCGDGISHHFLKYVLIAERESLNMFSMGTTHQTIYYPEVKALHVALPPRFEQDTIVGLLGALDDKIDLNRRMNETLEAMARAIFKDWFVDFGPTRAKAEGRAPYLAPELWNLFPGALDDEGKPVGWDWGTLAMLAEVNPESWSKRDAPEEVVYVDLANTKWGSIELMQHFPWRDAPSRAKRILRPGDTIVGLVRPGNGSFAFISIAGLTGSTGFAVLRPREPRYTQLVYLSATAPENIERLAHLADGAAYPAVRPEAVEATEVAIACDAVTIRFSALVSSIIGRIESNKNENQTLAQTRDLLLPRLMSGKIRLREAEQAMEAVA